MYYPILHNDTQCVYYSSYPILHTTSHTHTYPIILPYYPYYYTYIPILPIHTYIPITYMIHNHTHTTTTTTHTHILPIHTHHTQYCIIIPNTAYYPITHNTLSLSLFLSLFFTFLHFFLLFPLLCFPSLYIIIPLLSLRTSSRPSAWKCLAKNSAFLLFTGKNSINLSSISPLLNCAVSASTLCSSANVRNTTVTAASERPSLTK